jgi:hypothetical protein
MPRDVATDSCVCALARLLFLPAPGEARLGKLHTTQPRSLLTALCLLLSAHLRSPGLGERRAVLTSALAPLSRWLGRPGPTAASTRPTRW